MRIPITSHRRISSRSLCARKLVLAVAAAAAILGTQAIAAQTPSAPSVPAPKPHRQKVHPGVAQAAGQAAQAAPAPTKPAVPEPPHWPANDKPAQATIVWDSQGLRIEAANSSLQQILKDVSTVAGVKVEGLGTDERVFGAYGPGLARDVLSQLLQGSGYNVLMIGDQGQGAPRQIVLTSRNPADAAAANKDAASSEDDSADDAEEQPQQQPPTPAPIPMRPGFAPGGPPRNPQQMMQDMQQRQQQMQQRTPPQ